ncbi:MAG: IS630 family transposase [Acidobacteria bacterium]|nr:IS630 family transposase [Candidatus Sulfomarinibacter kjeldsenii]
MPPRATPIELTDQERQTLNQWMSAGTTEHRLVERAQIILLAAEGRSTRDIADQLRTRTARISKWRTRFAQERLSGLSDAARSGKPAKYTADTEKRMLALLDQPPPKGYSQWSGPLLAEQLGDVDVHQVWRLLRQRGISLVRRRSWCISTDPEFGPKAADIVGLYLAPPEHALVLCVDEKPSIQALERAQGWLRLPDGKALNGFSHGYKRHGTTTLFAALDVATGQVQTGHYQRRRRREFLDFMNGVVAAHPEREIHVVFDNFHYTPTYSSWLNQVEVWFSILSRKALQGASFTSPRQLRRAIDNFVEAHNSKAAPFEWTKAVVHPTAPKQRYSDLCK